MRVVAGSARGRRLRAPPGGATRPTSDRVREAVFSALASRGTIGDATVADLFAGTGAMGIEALSRGAERATFVDSDPRAVEVIAANLAATGFEERARVVRSEVLSWLEQAEPVDLAFADPPYAFDGWTGLLDRLRAGTVVVESDREVDFGAGWVVVQSRRYGSTVVTLAHATKGGR